MRRGKKIAAALTAVLALGMFSGCGQIDADAVAVTVAEGEDTVTLGYANFVAKYTQAVYETTYGSSLGEDMWNQDLYGNGNTFEEDVKNDVMDSLQEQYLLVNHASDYGVELTEEDTAAIETAAEQFMSDNTQEALDQMGATQEYVEQMLTWQTLSGLVSEAIRQQAQPTATEEDARMRTFTYVFFNTASVTANPDGVFKLRPRLENFSPATTLVLATPLTLAGLRAKEKGFMTADTRELAVLVEITASLKCKSRLRPDMSGLVGYLKEKLPPCGVERVVLGCSHYIYLAEQIAALYPDVPVCDGNADLLKEIAESVFPEKLSENSARNASDVRPSADGATGIRNTDITPTTDLAEQYAAVSPAPFTAGEKYSPASCRDEELRERVRSVKMFFTGEKEDKKYRWLLLKLLEGYAAAFRFPC